MTAPLSPPLFMQPFRKSTPRIKELFDVPATMMHYHLTDRRDSRRHTTEPTMTTSIACLAATLTDRAAALVAARTAATASDAALAAAKQALRDADAACEAAYGALSDASIERDEAAIAELAWLLAGSHVDDARRVGYEAVPSDATDCFESAQMERDLREIGIADDDGKLVEMLGRAIGEMLAIYAGYAAREAAYHAAERAAELEAEVAL